MKKSLIALAVLAAAGAASAQSSVTLYGVVDASIGNIKDTLSATATKITDRQNTVDSSSMRNSRWGVKGSEDLGNGLKANFVLEQGFMTDTGAVSATKGHGGTTDGFNREANVGVSGNFGAVKLGRVYSAYDDARALTNNTADHNFAATRDVWNTTGSKDYNIRFDNAVRFDSAVYNGFSGAVAYGFGENKETGKDANNIFALHVKYVNGPLAVAYAHQNEKQQTVDSNKFNLIGASYDFGVAKLTGSYNKVKAAASVEDSEYQIGVSAPVGPVILYAGYAHAKSEKAGDDSKSHGYDLLAVYPLSKRTDLYGGYKSVTDKDSKGDKEGEKKQFAVGVRHAF